MAQNTKQNTKLRKIAEAIKKAQGEYARKKEELAEKFRHYGLEPVDYFEVLIEKNLKGILGENIEVRLANEDRGFIINGSTLYEFINFGLVVTVYKYYLKDQITL